MRDRASRVFALLTAITVAAFVALVLLARVAFGAPAPGDAVKHWNLLCESIAAQDESLRALDESLHRLHPDRAVDARRLELYTAAILEAERQAALLKAMRRAEFGKDAPPSLKAKPTPAPF
jgi:hypothetical protein